MTVLVPHPRRPSVDLPLRALTVGALWCLTTCCGSPTGLQDRGQPHDTATAEISSSPEVTPNPAREVLFTRLEVDLGPRRATATVELAASERPGASLEVGDLEILAVSDGQRPLDSRRGQGWLHLALPATDRPARVVIEYLFNVQPRAEGEIAGGSTITWPYYCRNIFPCHSAPADGARFELHLAGVPVGQTAVYPRSLPFDGPAYMVAWAVGDLVHRELGMTAAGTTVHLWCAAEDLERGLTGTRRLVQSFQWFEQTLGPYRYGDQVGSVGVDWPGAGFGGMEHHPFWHIERASLEQETLHIHEAAHGWIGNGVRIACWEDFVLSEGTTSYLTARALTEVAGSEAGAALWTRYRARLETAQAQGRALVAWPRTCGEVDVLEIFSSVPYMKGAFFLRAVAEEVGEPALDHTLAAFYQRYQGQAARMSDLLQTIEGETGFDPAACAERWLRQAELPEGLGCPAAAQPATSSAISAGSSRNGPPAPTAEGSN